MLRCIYIRIYLGKQSNSSNRNLPKITFYRVHAGHGKHGKLMKNQGLEILLNQNHFCVNKMNSLYQIMTISFMIHQFSGGNFHIVRSWILQNKVIEKRL